VDIRGKETRGFGAFIDRSGVTGGKGKKPDQRKGLAVTGQ